ncbi:CRISPR system precrRNA processing endoribonuclease RAMP protein Cas6 [Campylobacter canadensis]|uniref:CRISPR system precrRNA processing endoribonuclease RAMP protein Cas6 n=1 Tax=Campylobacter canadensis TaxID=449520 RepID=A0ABS7WSN7_9BACT|nr:CRISPR system precrRNA processing endoribonuclease RAMP protein Cas6 [Campylobacter canadensis]MBZ7987773.1 CRISPR system precrRNA processing endoribonuclease RAMP protein Cas6 [Campylobacter canadensis]MBZ7995092.1 CRISPR system precrRNA processing endoribonuclease RAMP protein Cas6 [Campylobacter canadensis]MBZ7996634.1 CRISPR system precrRNA processing endoribonuclease RAMP protein Cas6 [Campylobacter canadensis]MBZ7998570.1 CRISPR system precrRNA processing endoribonuclease RAMP protein 
MKYVKLSVKNININTKYEFNGSAIRGTLGWALKSVDENVFALFFNKDNTNTKYRLDVDFNTYDFSIYLFNEYIKFTPYFALAIEKMRAFGLGVNRQKFDYEMILLNDEAFMDNKGNVLNKDIKSLEFVEQNVCKNVKVIFKSPFMINDKKSNFDPLSFFISIKRRVNEMNKISERVFFDNNFLFSQKLYDYNLLRYSNNQGKKMNFFAKIGEINFYNLDEECFKLLDLSTLIGVGKHTAFGFGKIILERMENE